jgi:hypothetical protein
MELTAKDELKRRIAKLRTLPGYAELKAELTPIRSAVVSTWVVWGGAAKCNAYECGCHTRKAAFVINIGSEFPGLICKAGAAKMVAKKEATYRTDIIEGTDLKKIIAKNKLNTEAKYEAYRAAHPELKMCDHKSLASAWEEAGHCFGFALTTDDEGYFIHLPKQMRPSLKGAR